MTTPIWTAAWGGKPGGYANYWYATQDGDLEHATIRSMEWFHSEQAAHDDFARFCNLNGWRSKWIETAIEERRIGGVNPPEPKDLRPAPTPPPPPPNEAMTRGSPPPSPEAAYIATLRAQLDEAQAEVKRLRKHMKDPPQFYVTGRGTVGVDEWKLAALADGPEET